MLAGTPDGEEVFDSAVSTPVWVSDGGEPAHLAAHDRIVVGSRAFYPAQCRPGRADRGPPGAGPSMPRAIPPEPPRVAA